MLRTPSPGPPLLAELSTIIEVDSSGISKHVPLLSPSTESSHSLSPPTSPNHDDPEEHTIRRPILHPPTTPLMTSSPLSPNTPAQPSSSSPNDADASMVSEAELELSTSQLASQIKDAMARTSWTGTDKALVIDADTGFLQIHGSQEENAGGNGDNDSAADVDASLLAVLDVKLDSSPSSSELGNDHLSHINNSTSSVVNPNELQGVEDATLDLGSLDPDLRAAATYSTSLNNSTFRKPTSPSSLGHSSTSGKTIRLSSPPLRPLNHPHTSPRSVSAGSAPSISASSSSASTTLTKQAPSLNSSIPQPKKRVASTFLPRLLSPPPYSAPVSAKNSPSPRKMSFESTSNPRMRRGSNPSNATASPKSPAFFQGNSGGGGSSRGPDTPNSAYRVSSTGSAASGSALSISGSGNTPTSAEFGVGFAEKMGGGGLMTSTPMKVKVKKGVVRSRNGGGHGRKSSVPVATWRHSRERFEQDEDGEEREVEVESASKVGLGPEVRVVEASGEYYFLPDSR